jgi:formiminoglutamase
MADQKRWGWLGIADHQGVVNVGGRVGADGGPKAFAQAFGRFTGEEGVPESLGEFRILEPRHADIEACHSEAARAVRELHRRRGLSVVIGGGNDYSFAQLQGVRDALPPGARLGCVNIDAHFDLRAGKPVITSGSPFRMAIESGVLAASRLVEFGIQRHCNRPDLWQYAREQHIETHLFEDLRHGRAGEAYSRMLSGLSARCDAVVVSLDLDAAAAAFAPGVSAPQSEGFDASDLCAMMAASGADAKVVSLGVYELNPQHDVDQRTAILAAKCVYDFVAAVIRSRPPRAS